MRKHCLIVVLAALICQLVSVTARSADDHWVWRTYSRRERAFHDKDVDRSASLRKPNQNQLKREPTTRRPLPGEPENDEIEDYVDVEPTVTTSPNVGTRQYNPYDGGNPYGGFGGQPGSGGQFPGLGGFGGGSPGVLVGPGGPTGIIGRPPVYPNVYQPGFGGAQNGLGAGSYPGGFGNAGAGASYPGIGAGGQGYPGIGAGGAGYPGIGAGGAGYPGIGAGGQGYPGVGSGFQGQLGGQPGGGLGQYPGSGSQYPFGSYPGSNYNNQFATQGGQYPGLGQYPTNQYAGPLYTEGYGLANFGQPGLPPTGFGGNFGGFGYDEKSPAVNEGKSAKNVDLKPVPVNDKLNKKI